MADGTQIGVATSMAHSPRLAANLALLLVEHDWATAGIEVEVGTSDGLRTGTTEALPFVTPTKT
jgi:glycine cleavage system aminomethyltransferase T